MQGPSNISAEIKQRIETALPGAQVEINSASDRHYEISIISESFEGLSQVKQHQLVYSTITDLMDGNDAPIHAIDKMNLSVS